MSTTNNKTLIECFDKTSAKLNELQDTIVYYIDKLSKDQLNDINELQLENILLNVKSYINIDLLKYYNKHNNPMLQCIGATFESRISKHHETVSQKVAALQTYIDKVMQSDHDQCDVNNILLNMLSYIAGIPRTIGELIKHTINTKNNINDEHNVDDREHNVDDGEHNVDDGEHNVDDEEHNVDDEEHNVDDGEHNELSDIKITNDMTINQIGSKFDIILQKINELDSIAQDMHQILNNTKPRAGFKMTCNVNIYIVIIAIIIIRYLTM
jgi:hypothetical protein